MSLLLYTNVIVHWIRRLLTAQATPQDLPHSRSVLLHGISSPDTVSKLLDKHPVGPLQSFSYHPENTRVFLKFYEPSTAAKFFSSVRKAKPQLDVRIRRGKQRPLEADVVAAIGCRGASRCIAIDPAPEGETEDSLGEDLAQFGAVEKVDFKMRYARVHFCDVRFALRAVEQLAPKEGEEGAKVYFTPERNDDVFIQKQSAVHGPDSTPNEPSRKVLLSNLQEPVVLRLIAWLVRGTLPDKEAVLLSMKRKFKTRDIYLDFLRIEDAARFTENFNSQAPKLLPQLEGAKAIHITQVHPVPYDYNSVARAVSLGASRQLSIRRIKGCKKEDAPGIRDDFGQFGHVARVFVDEANNMAYIEYADIMDAMGAIEQIHARTKRRDPSLKRYAGAHISFVKPNPSINPLYPVVIPQHFHTNDAEAKLATDAE
ncbi:hypothetical protein V5O48_008044 [Marasmius crinis-equi]|uniref:RRM domain-containing protein n=1 Tax=Marasmius crinis-equi TaxID=585013 RepID=A0ABR3FF55_9AGAR